MKKRIWELDTLRGLFLIGMIGIHFFYDITELYPLVQVELPRWFARFLNSCGISFVVLSGCCVTLGRRNIRRGLTVLGCGLLCTLATFLLARFGPWSDDLIIWFGVLHCLGCCMLLWSAFRNLPWWALILAGVAFRLLGFWAEGVTVSQPALIVLGFRYPGFASSDYFPLLAHLGLFLLGAAAGKLLYREKTSLLPKVNDRNPLLRCLQFIGRHSLIIYLAHQPVLAGITTLIFMLTRG